MDLRLRTESFGVEDQTWLGSAHGTDAARSVTLDVDTFVSGTHYPNGYLPSGIPLGKITADGTYGLYDPEADDGRAVLAGFLFTTQAVNAGAESIVAPMLDHGKVILANLPVAIADAAAAAADVEGRIIFVDLDPSEGGSS